MKSEKQKLIHDLLAGGEEERRRLAVLSAGARVLRHKRYTRLGARCGTIALVTGLLVLAVHRMADQKNETPVIAATTNSMQTAKAELHYLTDDELLNLFPDTPVALATIGGKKRLIFPRPGDEARFIHRLPN